MRYICPFCVIWHWFYGSPVFMVGVEEVEQELELEVEEELEEEAFTITDIEEIEIPEAAEDPIGEFETFIELMGD